jgi:hypothetical protein
LTTGFEPSGFKDWRWGAVYTIRPVTLKAGRSHNRMVTVRQKIAADQHISSYESLYQRATFISAAHPPELPGAHSTITNHSWGRYDGAIHFAFAAVSTTFTLDAEAPLGEPAPSSADLAIARTPAIAGGNPSQVFDEIYNDFDFRSEAESELAMFSYGEYVPACEGVDYEPFLERAADRAEGHHASLRSAVPYRIERREWMPVPDARLVVVHIYFRG